MPSVSTSVVVGNNESIEPITSNLFTKNTLSGVFTVVNKHLISDLMELDLWNKDLRDKLIYCNGSVQDIREIPKKFRDIYKTVYEIDQKDIITMSKERGPFISHSQSLNLFFEKPTFRDITSCHFFGWKSGLKTGCYYLRTKAARNGDKFGMDANRENEIKLSIEKGKIEDEDEGCLACSG